MKKTVACIMLAVLLVFSFGCKQAEKEPEPTPTPEQTLEPTPEPTPTPEPEANREDYSETTGLLKAEDYVYQPIGVMIDAASDAVLKQLRAVSLDAAERCIDGNPR